LAELLKLFVPLVGPLFPTDFDLLRILEFFLEFRTRVDWGELQGVGEPERPEDLDSLSDIEELFSSSRSDEEEFPSEPNSPSEDEPRSSATER
jgi:hypothetical protein